MDSSVQISDPRFARKCCVPVVRVPELQQDLDALAQRLDDEYFVVQESAEDGNASEAEVQRAFSQARAVSALAFASDENMVDAVTEAIVAVDENKELLAIVLKACG